MKLRHLTFVLLSTLAAALAAPPQDDLLRQTFAKMDAAAATFRGMTADVKRVAYVDVIPESDVETGTIAVKKPKPKDLRMRVDIKQPDQRMICFSGHTAEVYNPKINTVQVYDVNRIGKGGSAMVEQLALLGFGSSSRDVQSRYDVTVGGTETISGQKAVRLVLIPKASGKIGDISKIELWISDAPQGTDASGLALQQKIYEAKDYNLATYSNIKLDRNVPESAVKCSYPRNAQVEYPAGR
jgi:outer membrane lipoprotein-sorting protein